jgi:hypothetical protein
MISVEEFILALDAEITEGARAEVALRRVVVRMAERIRQKENLPAADEEH